MQKLVFSILLSSCLLLLTSFQMPQKEMLLHPFFVSISQIDYNPKYKSLEISMKVFSDDFASCLEKQAGVGKLYLHTAKENPQANAIISKYVSSSFSVLVNGKVVKMNFLGKEKEDDATWIYLEIPNVNKVQSLNISNKILLECYDSQTNMVNTNINGVKKSLVLKRNNPTETLSF